MAISSSFPYYFDLIHISLLIEVTQHGLNLYIVQVEGFTRVYVQLMLCAIFKKHFFFFFVA
jgi:hypothetical protein